MPEERREREKAIEARMKELEQKPLKDFVDEQRFVDRFEAVDEILSYLNRNFSGEKWGFRGQRDAEWSLVPRIERLSGPGGYTSWEREDEYVRDAFKRRARQYLPSRPESYNNLLVHAFVGDDLHWATGSTGYSTSARNAPAANAKAARTASSVRRGCAARI